MFRRVTRFCHLLPVVTILMCTTTSPAWAEEPVQGTVDSRLVAGLSAHHRFLDNTNALLTGIETAGLITDASSTRRVLDQYPGWTIEADPIARPFVEAGWPGQIAGGLLFVAAEMAGRYALHRGGHHRLERLLPLVVGALEFSVTVHNIRGLHDLDRDMAAGLIR